uniref:NUDIX domain-containing protein n=1 Tax=Streptomyces sp. NBC_00008 TaxID=2903610 RepID=A0AAU2VUW1_9ACTN
MSLHSVSVAGVVVREDGRVLVIRRADNGAWEAPGGVLELDERPEDGVCREVLEETGVKVDPVRLSGDALDRTAPPVRTHDGHRLR